MANHIMTEKYEEVQNLIIQKSGELTIKQYFRYFEKNGIFSEEVQMIMDHLQSENRIYYDDENKVHWSRR